MLNVGSLVVGVCFLNILPVNSMYWTEKNMRKQIDLSNEIYWEGI